MWMHRSSNTPHARASHKGRRVRETAARTLQLVILVLALALSACGFMKAKEDAELAVSRHFEAIASHSEPAVLAGYDEQFFAVVPRDEWAKRLATVEAKLGQYQSFSVASWKVNSRMGAGTYATLTCNVQYTKHAATEAMELYRANDDEPFKIVKHGINSDAFLSE